MDYRPVKKMLNYKFDFEIGYLIKSPCKECDTIEFFPNCIDTCDILDKIHIILSEAISCTNK